MDKPQNTVIIKKIFHTNMENYQSLHINDDAFNLVIKLISSASTSKGGNPHLELFSVKKSNSHLSDTLVKLFNIDSTMEISDIKFLISYFRCIPIEKQKLKFNETILESTTTNLGSYNIIQESILHLEIISDEDPIH